LLRGFVQSLQQGAQSAHLTCQRVGLLPQLAP
jgi:hypothetical protein